MLLRAFIIKANNKYLFVKVYNLLEILTFSNTNIVFKYVTEQKLLQISFVIHLKSFDSCPKLERINIVMGVFIDLGTLYLDFVFSYSFPTFISIKN